MYTKLQWNAVCNACNVCYALKWVLLSLENETKQFFSPIRHLLHEQSTNHISLKSRPGCNTESPTVQDAFRPLQSLISCTGVTRRWGLLLISCIECSQMPGLNEKMVEKPFESTVSCLQQGLICFLFSLLQGGSSWDWCFAQSTSTARALKMLLD